MKRLAWMCTLAMAMGCGGDDDNSNPDAGSSDAAPEIDAAPQPGACGAEFNVGPIIGSAGQTVVFAGPAGIIGTETTDANGAASREDCVPGTSITIALTQAGGDQAQFLTLTIAGVNPGETARLVQGSGSNDPITDSVTVTTAAAPATTTSVVAGMGCTSTTGNVAGGEATLNNVTQRCLGDTATNVDLLATAFGPGETALAFDWATDITPVANDVTAVGTLPGWKDAVTMTHSFSNVPTIGNAQMGNGFYRDGLSYFNNGAGATPENGTATNQRPGPPTGFADQVYFETSVERPQSASYRRTSHAPETTSFSHDYNDHLPELMGVVVSAPTPAQPTISWVANGDLSGTTMGLLLAFWETETSQHIAYIFAPGSTPSPVQLPPLPDSLTSYRPALGVTFQGGGGFVEIEGKSFSQLINEGFNPNLIFDPRSSPATVETLRATQFTGGLD